MLLGALIGIKVIDLIYLTKPMSFIHFIRFLVLFLTIIVYISINAYLIVNFRTKKYL